MSQYNKTVLTNAGLELAKRANAGQAKFEITRAVTSADDWSNKTIQDLEAVTAIPNIMQQGIIMDTNEVESNNSVIGVSLCFTNKNLNTGYQIRIIGLYAKEEGQENDCLYAVTTAITPEYMPDFSDEVLYRFNMQMYLVIGKAQAVNVVINDGTAVTPGQFDKYKNEVTADLEKIENTHKEDMGHVVKSASINGGNEVLPDEKGKIALVVPDPDLSKYVNVDDLKEMLNTKANASDVTEISGRLGKLEGAQTVDSPDFNTITATGVYYITNNTPANIKNNPVSQWGVLVVSSGNGQRISQVYYPDDGSPQWCRLLNGSNWLPWYQLSTKKDVSNATNLANQAQETANTKANSADVYTKTEVDGKLSTISNNALPKAGGDMDEKSTINWNGAGSVNSQDGNIGGVVWNGATDWAKIYGDNDGNDNLDLAFDLGGDGSNHFSFRKNGVETSAISSDGHYSGTVDWINVNGRPDVASLQNTVNNIDSTRTPIITGVSGDDLFAFKTNQIRLYPGNGKTCKNLPPAANTQWFTVQYIFETPNNDGIAIYRSPYNEIWTAGCNGKSYNYGWIRVANANDITSLQNQIQQLKDNQFEVQTFTDATAAANWEAQRPGHRLAIIQS